MAVEALASVSNGQSTNTSNEPIQKRPVNDTGRVSVNRALELGKGSDETIEKSINIGKPLEERLAKISDVSSSSLTSKNNQASEDNDNTSRRLLDDSMQKRIFDSEKLEERLQRSVQTLNQRMEELGRSVRFSVDRVFDKEVISVVNPDSGDLIRQIPPEAALRVSEGVKSLRGMLFDDKA